MTRLVARPVPWAPRGVLAESPRWHDGRWWWVDATPGLVYTARPVNARQAPGDDSTGDDRADVPVDGAGRPGAAAHVWLSVGERVCMVHPAVPEGSMVIACGAVLQVFRDTDPNGHDGVPGERAGGSVAVGSMLAELPLPAGWLLNDGTADPAGGMYIGVVHPDRAPGSGYLQHIRPDGRLGDTVPGIGLSNGLALDPSGMVLYHADSTGRRVLAHRLDSGGEITGSATHLRFDSEVGMPDGLSTDVDGGLWVALYGAGEVRRYAPDGEVDLVVDVPVPQVTSVAIGGPDGRDVLITTAREGYDERRSEAEPLAGCLFAARSPYPGRKVLPAASHEVP